MRRDTRSPSESRTVYTTDPGPPCPICRLPWRECRCTKAASHEPVPARIVAKLRIEKSGRGGKTVTVVDGLPRNHAFLESLASELKKALGTGGAALEASVEIQGDRRDALRARLTAKGWTVKG